MTALDRIDAKTVHNSDGCHEWTGGVNSRGYGKIQIDRRTQLVHRLVYAHRVGSIPTDLTIDHLCRNKRCVNPAHLEVVTRAENTRRGLTRTHCAKGHAFVGDNVLYDTRTGHRDGCRECHRLRNRMRAAA